MKKYKFTYEKSGVNINAGDNFVKYIANLNKKKKLHAITIILEALHQSIASQQV